MDELDRLFEDQRGVATSGQILQYLTRRGFEAEVKTGNARTDLARHLLSRRARRPTATTWPGLVPAATAVPVCLGTAAALHGFDTEQPADFHVLSPPGSRLRSADGLVVHRRDGAPLVTIGERPATSPAWTAVEVARSLRRPRALATLDAALRSGTCARPELWRAAVDQAGRRGIVAVRDLIPLADGLAESPMESEARLAMIDGGLPIPTLQYEIIDGNGELRRLDFAWPEERVAVEYDGIDWHSGADAMRRDRRRHAALLGRWMDRDCHRVRGREVSGVGFRCPHRRAASSRSRGVSDRKMPTKLRRVVYRHGRSAGKGLGAGADVAGRAGTQIVDVFGWGARDFGGIGHHAEVPGRRYAALPRVDARTATPAPDRWWCPTTAGPPGSGSSCGCPALSLPSGRGSSRPPWSCRRARRRPSRRDPRRGWPARLPSRCPRRRTSAASRAATPFPPSVNGERAPASAPDACSIRRRRRAARGKPKASPTDWAINGALG